MRYIIALVLTLLTFSAQADVQCRKYARTNPEKTEDEVITSITCPPNTFLSSITCNVIDGYGMSEAVIISGRSARCHTWLYDTADNEVDDNGNLIEGTPVYGNARIQVLCCKG